MATYVVEICRGIPFQTVEDKLRETNPDIELTFTHIKITEPKTLFVDTPNGQEIKPCIGVNSIQTIDLD